MGTGSKSKRPRIGITAWRRPLPTFLGEATDLYTLGTEYVESVTRAGGLPVIVPQSDDPAQLLDMLDGLVLSGGDDIDPSSYGETATDAVHGASSAADRWEISLVREARSRGLPVLGICRGMQIMAVAFGGRLEQDLAGAEGHPDVAGMSSDEILAERHAVELAPGCGLALAYGRSERTVNSIHHQGVVDPGDLRVVGWGPGDVIEAVEPPDAWPAVGVQWHPEKMDDISEESLFEKFIERCVRYRDSALLETLERAGA